MTSTEKTSKRRTVADAEAELIAYKKQVRDEAIRVAAQQSWCDTGLNETLRNLALPEKRNYDIPIRVQVEVIRNVTVTGAESEEDARSKVFGQGDGQQWVREQYGSGYRYLAHEVPEPVTPDEAKVGDVDPTRAERLAARQSDTTNPGGVTRRTCEKTTDDFNYYCNRPAGHPPTQHVAVTDYVVVAVWPVDEAHPVREVTDNY